jgi:hypothetical protein
MAQTIRTLVSFRRVINETKPRHAGAYFLNSEDQGRWPRLGGYTFDPFEVDPELPSGTYRLYYLSSQTSGLPLPTPDGRPSPDIEWHNPKVPASAEGDDDLGGETSEGTALAEELGALATEGQPKQESKTLAKTDDPALRRHRREVEQERFARDIADSRLLLGQKMRHAGESAELLVVMRAYRTELEKATRLPMSLSMEYLEATKRSHNEYAGMFADFMKKNAELANRVMELQKNLPPAPQPSLLRQLASPEGLAFAKFIAEQITGKEGDADTVVATEEDDEIKKLRAKRDQARAKLRRLQAAAKKQAGTSKKEPAKPKNSGASTKPARRSAGKVTNSESKPGDRGGSPPKSSKKKKPSKPPVKGSLTEGEGK